MASRKNVFVLGLDAFNRRLLQSIHHADSYRFHALLDNADVDRVEGFRVPDLLEAARAQLRGFRGSVDALVGYIDIPAGLIQPVICGELGLVSPSFDSVLKCQHKYWNRLLCREVAAEHVPRFRAVDPFDDRALDALDLPYPFWLKPVKSAGSYLGFRIGNRRDLARAVTAIRTRLPGLAEPLNELLPFADLPPGIAGVDFHHCVAEEIIGGRQCTLEGVAHAGQIHVYAVVDSIRYPNRTSFLRYEYPSALPVDVQRRMASITERVVGHTRLDDSPFNIEFFWDVRRDRIWLLEINTRISQSHSPLFEAVDGASNHQIMVETGLGRRPELPYRQGPFRYGAKIFLRRFTDAWVESVPDKAVIRALESRYPGTTIHVKVAAGTYLSERPDQDSYSYQLAWIFTGAQSRRELIARERALCEGLHFRFAPASRVEGTPATRGDRAGVPGAGG